MKAVISLKSIKVLMITAGIGMSIVVSVRASAGEASDALPPSPVLSKMIPTAKISVLGTGNVAWSGKIIGGKSLRRRYPVLFSRIPEKRTGVPIVIKLNPKIVNFKSRAVRNALMHDEGYVLQVTGAKIEIIASSKRGITRGLVRLAALDSKRSSKITFGTWIDWPDFQIRAVHFSTSRDVSLSDMERIASLASEAEFNSLVVLITPEVGLSSYGKLSKHPVISQSQFKRFVAYAHQSGLTVVPELPLLTHQELLLGNHYPSLMFNSKTYNPSKTKVYDIVFPIINQLVKMTGAHKFLIGHDELAGWGNPNPHALAALKQGETPLPARLFLTDVRKIHAHLKALGVTTWMWGDMLLRPGPNVSRTASLYMHGRLPGYGPKLLNALPRDIVICNWLYTGKKGDFNSARKLENAGFPVLGATFKSEAATSAYARFGHKIGLQGMIATTWYYVQRHDWGRIQTIVRDSAQSFWNAASK